MIVARTPRTLTAIEKIRNIYYELSEDVKSQFIGRITTNNLKLLLDNLNSGIGDLYFENMENGIDIGNSGIQYRETEEEEKKCYEGLNDDLQASFIYFVGIDEYMEHNETYESVFNQLMPSVLKELLKNKIVRETIEEKYPQYLI